MEKTELQIFFSDIDIEEADKFTKDLKKFVDADETIKDMTVSQIRKELQEGEAGGIFDTALNFVFGKDFLGKILDLIGEWIKGKADRIKARQENLKISFELDGKKFTWEGTNVEDTDKILNSFKGVFEFVSNINNEVKQSQIESANQNKPSDTEVS